MLQAGPPNRATASGKLPIRHIKREHCLPEAVPDGQSIIELIPASSGTALATEDRTIPATSGTSEVISLAASHAGDLERSYTWCRRTARRAGKNFYYSFLTLPRDQFRAMCVLYAFMRVTDDIGDDETRPLDARRRDLADWREATVQLLGGARASLETRPAIMEHPLFPAFRDTVERYAIPQDYLLAAIDGVAMDLDHKPCATFADLEQYCYHVAGAVGLCCLHIWGFDNPPATPGSGPASGRSPAESAAIACGLAFQLTNILRDLQEDARAGRCYLPQEDLTRFGVTPDDLLQGRCDERFRGLMQFETARARAHYATARELFAYVHPPGRPVLAAMLWIYGGLLDKIERRKFRVFSRRIRLSPWRKLWYAGWAFVRYRLGL